MKIHLINTFFNKAETYSLKFFNSKQSLNSKEKEFLEKLNFNFKSNDIFISHESKIVYFYLKSDKKDDIRVAFANLSRKLNENKVFSVLIDLSVYKTKIDLKIVFEGLYLGDYKFNKYLKKDNRSIEVYLLLNSKVDNLEYLNKKLDETRIISESVNFVRDIVNTPAMDYYPKIMADDSKLLEIYQNVSCNILGEKELEELNLNAILAVSKASEHEAKLIHLNYKPKVQNPLKIVLVGKGVTYDTGGMSLKRGSGMESMKIDKAGAITVIGIIKAVAKLKLPIEIHGVVGAVENMVDSKAYKPGDIVNIDGKNVEITNTDAEGRLVLADCFSYINKKKIKYDYIFDFATLTGASINSFGGYACAILGKNKKLKDLIEKASKKTDELVAYMPYNRHLENRLQSNVADFLNSPANKNASSIIATMFLSKFVKNQKKWFHFDMAGPAYRKEIWGYNPYGASGYGIRLILELLKRLNKKHKRRIKK